MVMPYHLHMPSYFLETFTEYPFLLLSRMKVIHIDKTFYPSTAIFQPKTLPALPVERQTYTLPILPDEAT